MRALLRAQAARPEARPGGRRRVVLVGGRAGLDGGELEPGGEAGALEVAAANPGGCLCCEDEGGLLRQVLELAAAPGGALAEVLVECSGMRPSSVAASLFQQLLLEGIVAEFRCVCVGSDLAWSLFGGVFFDEAMTADPHGLEELCDQIRSADAILWGFDAGLDLAGYGDGDPFAAFKCDLLRLVNPQTPALEAPLGLDGFQFDSVFAAQEEGMAEKARGVDRALLDPGFRYRSDVEWADALGCSIKRAPAALDAALGCDAIWSLFESRRPFSTERLGLLFLEFPMGLPDHAGQAASGARDGSEDLKVLNGAIATTAAGDAGGGRAAHPFQHLVLAQGLLWLSSDHLNARHWAFCGGASYGVACVSDAGPWWATCPEETWPCDERFRGRIRDRLRADGDDRRQEVYLVARGRERLEAVEAALRACVLTDAEFAAYTQALVGYRDIAQCVACSPGASAAAPKPVVRSKFF